MPAMPPMMPSAVRSRTAPAGSVACTQAPSCANIASIRSIGSCASANSVQNIPPITAAKTRMPRIGWVNASSRRCVRLSPPEPMPVTLAATALSAHASSAWSPSRPSGVCAPPLFSTSATIAVSRSTASPRRATIGTTGQPISFDSAAASSVSPRRCARSTMFSATTTGSS